jgi:hypothetical protein
MYCVFTQNITYMQNIVQSSATVAVPKNSPIPPFPIHARPLLKHPSPINQTTLITATHPIHLQTHRHIKSSTNYNHAVRAVPIPTSRTRICKPVPSRTTTVLPIEPPARDVTRRIHCALLSLGCNCSKRSQAMCTFARILYLATS